MINNFAVIGNPIAHSLSPFIHHRFAEQRGIDLNYVKIKGSEATFESQVHHFFAQGGKGLNITLPFKQKAFAIAALRTTRCEQAKAANTLWMRAGQLHADNTDGVGFISDLARYQTLAGKQVLLLGAGGAARGIIGPLLAADIAQLTIVNRTQEKIPGLQEDFRPITCSRLTELHNSYDIIIDARSTSLTEKKIALPSSILQATSFCYDLAYNTKGKTPFVAWAHEHGVLAIDGLGMLVEQAAEAFFIWHGVRVDPALVLDELRTINRL